MQVGPATAAVACLLLTAAVLHYEVVVLLVMDHLGTGRGRAGRGSTGRQRQGGQAEAGRAGRQRQGRQVVTGSQASRQGRQRQHRQEEAGRAGRGRRAGKQAGVMHRPARTICGLLPSGFSRMPVRLYQHTSEGSAV